MLATTLWRLGIVFGTLSVTCGLFINGIALAATAYALRVEGYPSVPVGQQGNVTLTAIDAAGAPVVAYDGTVILTSDDPAATLPGSYTFVPLHSGSVSLPVTFNTPGTHVIGAYEALSASVRGRQTGIVSYSNAIHHFTVNYPDNVGSGTNANATVVAYNANDVILRGYTGTVALVSSDGAAVLPANYTFLASDQGAASLPVTLKTIGSQSVTARVASAPAISGIRSGISVNGATALKLVLPATADANALFDGTVVAVDNYNNTVATYVGVVAFAATDYQFPTMPGNYNFLLADKGVKSFPNGFSLRTRGALISATDQANGAIRGSGTVALNAPQATTIRFGAPSVVVANTANAISLSAVDRYGNAVSSFSGWVTVSNTDVSGVPASGAPLSVYLRAGTATQDFSFGTTGYQKLTASYDGGALSGNSLILVNKLSNFSTSQAANFVISQATFTGTAAALGQNTTTAPRGPWVSPEGVLFISAALNHRVEAYSPFPSSNQPNASFVIGQPDFTTATAATTVTGLHSPAGVWGDGAGGMFITEVSNNRVVHYNTRPAVSNAPFDHVLGQANFTTSSAACNRTSLRGPRGVITYPNLDVTLVADSGNHRVLVYTPMIPASNGPLPTLVLGQKDFVTCQSTVNDSNTMKNPYALISTNGDNLIVADGTNDRVLIFKSMRDLLANYQNGPAADVVLGSNNFTDVSSAANPNAATVSQPSSLATDGINLMVGEYQNSRVTIWDSVPAYNGAPADRVLFQTGFTVNSGVCAQTRSKNVQGLFYYGNSLTSTHFGCNRSVVLISP